MPVKFYYVLAFRQGVFPLVHSEAQPHFLGKTSDLVFKTEPDKTLDLDDGSTEVGSEKLTLSFSILGAIQNPWPIGEVWLVPAISGGTYALGEYPPGSVLRVYLQSADDYRIETKSGEFELTHFSASLRYAANAPAYGYYYHFFDDYRIALFPNVSSIIYEGIGAGEPPYIQFEAWIGPQADWLIRDQAALIFEAQNEHHILVDGALEVIFDHFQKGIFTCKL